MRATGAAGAARKRRRPCTLPYKLFAK
jgi:hypothetical protein